MTSISFLQHSKDGFETGKKSIILQRNCKSKVDEENVNVALAEIKLGQFELASVVFKKSARITTKSANPYCASLDFEH